MEKETKKTIRKTFKENNFAIGDSSLLAATYIDSILKNANIISIESSFESTYKNDVKLENIKNIGNLIIIDDNNMEYNFSIMTFGVVNGFYDNNIVPFSINAKIYDENKILLHTIDINSGYHFDNKASIMIQDENEAVLCTSNNACAWNTIFAITDIEHYNKDNNELYCETSVNTSGNNLDERLFDLYNQVDILKENYSRCRTN